MSAVRRCPGVRKRHPLRRLPWIIGADVPEVALGIATRENSAAVVFILDVDDDLCPGGLGAPIDHVGVRHDNVRTLCRPPERCRRGLEPAELICHARDTVCGRRSRRPMCRSTRSWHAGSVLSATAIGLAASTTAMDNIEAKTGKSSDDLRARRRRTLEHTAPTLGMGAVNSPISSPPWRAVPTSRPHGVSRSISPRCAQKLPPSCLVCLPPGANARLVRSRGARSGAPR
jgi:hypothetical protein